MEIIRPEVLYLSAGIGAYSKPGLSGTRSTRGVTCDPSGKGLILVCGVGECAQDGGMLRGP